MRPPTQPAATLSEGSPSRGKEGQPLSIDLLHSRYLNAVYSYVLYRVPDHTEAEDITAETFVAAVKALPAFRGESGPYAWLLGIARRKIADAARRRGRTRDHELLEVDLTEHERETAGLLLRLDFHQVPEDAVLRDEAQEVMRQLMRSLPEQQREALLLQVRQGLSVREIAKIMGRSEAATNSLLQRARGAIFRLGRSYFQE